MTPLVAMQYPVFKEGIEGIEKEPAAEDGCW